MFSNRTEELFEEAFQDIPVTTGDIEISPKEATPPVEECKFESVFNVDDAATAADEYDDDNAIRSFESRNLEFFLDGLTASRDIDSVSILSNSLVALVKGMEENSIIRLYRTIGKMPTTSSRHYIKMVSTRINPSTGNQQRQTVKVPIHNFPNINLGTVTANNIRFHLNIFCLRSIGPLQGKRVAYRPFSHSERLVIVASMNLARLLQCKHISMINDAIDESEDLTVSNKSEMKILLESHEAPRDKGAPHHWVSGGDFFCLSNEHTNPIEISSRRDWAISFLSDFELSMSLIARGILKIPEIGGKCFAPSDTFVLKVTKKVSFLTDIQQCATVLTSSRVYTLTAAGTKHDFRQFKPFNPSLITLDADTCPPDFIEYMRTINQFDRWLREAGSFNRINLEKCFHHDDYDEEKLITTFDDAITFQCLKHDKFILALPASRSKMKYMFGCYDVDEKVQEDIAGDIEERSTYTNSEEECDDPIAEDSEGEEEETEENGNDEAEDKLGEIEANDNSEIEEIEENGEDQEVDTSSDNLAMASQNNVNAGALMDVSLLEGSISFDEYSILLNPTLSTYHSGRIQLQQIESESSGKTIKLVGCGSSSHIPVCNGSLLGCQLYITGVKNSKFASIIKKVSVLAHMDKASFGLMHPSLSMKEKYYKQRMDECLVEIGNIDFSENSFSDLMSRHYCLRVETFRAYIHGTNGNQQSTIVDFPIDICAIQLCTVDKNLLLRNYLETLNLAKTVLTNVFSGKCEGELNPRCLSGPAKMAVQYLSEIISFDIGNPSGYTTPGPIMKKLLLSSDRAHLCRGVHFPKKGVPLSDEEKCWTKLPHGLDPSLWIIIGNEQDVLKTQILTSLGYTMDPSGNDNTAGGGITHQPMLSVSLLERVRKRLSGMLFRYQKKNKDRDLVSWFIFVSTFMSCILPSTKQETNVFEAINFKNLAKIGSSGNIKLLELLIQGLAKIFWECYHWEWRGDLLTTKGFRHINHDFGKLEDWPRTMIGINEFTRKYGGEISRQIKQASKTVNTLEDLCLVLFQHRDLNTRNAADPRCTNWNTCIYLQLYEHIVNQLLMAREALIKTGSQLSSDSFALVCGMLTPTYFKCIMSLELVKASSMNDHPFIWHTGSNNRKKVIGQYVLVMKNELSLSSNQHMAGVFHQQSAMAAMEHLLPVTGTTDDKSSPLEWIPNLRKQYLHDALMEIPYNLKAECDIRGKYISFLHVLVYAIVDKCTRTEMEPFSLKVLSEKIRLKKDIGNIYMSLANPVSPLPPVVVGIPFHQVASSRVHMLWGSQDAFTHSVSNARRTIHNKLSRTTQDQQINLRGFQLKEFEDCVIKFAFSNDSEFSVYTMIIDRGVFDSLTLKKVEQLKLICHLISSAKGHGDKNKGGRMPEIEWKSNKKKVLLRVIEGCQTPNNKQIRQAFHRSTADLPSFRNPNRRSLESRNHVMQPERNKNGYKINSHTSNSNNSAATITHEIKKRKRN